MLQLRGHYQKFKEYKSIVSTVHAVAAQALARTCANTASASDRSGVLEVVVREEAVLNTVVDEILVWPETRSQPQDFTAAAVLRYTVQQFEHLRTCTVEHVSCLTSALLASLQVWCL